MKHLRTIILIILMTVSLSVMGVLVFWILENVFNFRYDNIVSEGIKIGVISSIVLFSIGQYIKKREKQ